MSSPINQTVPQEFKNGFLATAGLANWIGCGRDKIIDAYDEIEAAGITLVRVRDIGAGTHFIGKRMRKAA